ncbi:GDP-mannose mannosyl hydrolase [Gammaproteobacteria bacterium MOLA455]|nr:GDP-mannose mannosyl hydrolase [Gammaproteobacteria bacterium MOLA455]
MLEKEIFKTVIKNTPLVSIDLCIVWDGQVLLCKRTNEPLKGEWFTPGGRIHKNETWQGALLRIAKVELGLSGIAAQDFGLMGMWDHFYSNSAIDQHTSTHYVNLPHHVRFQSKPQITLDDQHAEFKWFDLAVVSSDKKFHPYMHNYATWLLNKIGDTHD